MSANRLMKYLKIDPVFILPKPTSKIIITFVNPTNFFYVTEVKDSFDFIYSDGILLTYLYRKRFNLLLNRVSFDFTSIADQVFHEAVSCSKKVAVIGATSEENQKAVCRLEQKYPGIDVALALDGYTSRENLIDQLTEFPVELIIAGLGSPLQEEFLMHCKKELTYNFVGFTCGGFVSQTAMSTCYYPEIINKLNLRWFIRFIRHKHVRKKLVFDYPLFLFRWLIRPLKFL